MLGQNSRLERDISKRESLACRRRDSIIDRNLKLFDSKRAKGLAVPSEQTLQVMKVGLNICSYIFMYCTYEIIVVFSFEFYCCRRLSNFLLI